MSDLAPHEVVLSLFPGAGLLDRGFTAAGFCVVRGPDTLWGHDVRTWRCAKYQFWGIIGGPPCQDFSSARRAAPTGEGLELLGEWRRIILEAAPIWYLMENVHRVPTVEIPGYHVQRFNLKASECGAAQSRLRTFQFGQLKVPGLSTRPLVIPRCSEPQELSPAAMASEGSRKGRRGWPEFCRLQGLPPDFDLVGMTRAGKYRCVGNGVPVQMATVLAQAVKEWRHRGAELKRVCVCECGREVPAGKTLATPACRKRMQRRRDSAAVHEVGPVTRELL